MGDTFGSGRPNVLALHGWSRSRADFASVLARPDAKPLDAIALDLPGFGASPPPPEGWGSADYAKLVARVLPEMAEPVVVIGHSFGGRVALELAVSRPESIAGLVLTGVPLLRRQGAGKPPVPFRVGRALRRAGVISEGRMESLRQRYGSADYRASQGVMRQVLVRVVNERYDDAIAAVACPVVLLWGENDEVETLDMARQALGSFRDARLVVLPGVGHMTPVAEPKALHDAVLDLLP
jgi:pimeloyl-ACP methyl ester carboxylesterase